MLLNECHRKKNIIKNGGTNMNRFCRECGKEMNEEHSHCIHCGTPFHEDKAPAEVSVQKEPMSKKNKIISGSIISVIVLLISLHVWANNHFSYESVEKRFEAAVEENNTKKITKLVTHEDGSSISKKEAEAFASLVKTGGNVYLKELTNIFLDGKVLGMYDSYKVEVLDQFVTYDNFVEGLSFEFNEEEFPVYEKNDKSITYGPLAPGEYTVEATFKDASDETSIEDTLTVASSFGEHTWLDMNIPISMVHFYVENYYDFKTSDAYILVNDEEYNISADGETDEIGPFIIDGSQQVNVVVNMPWGEIVSDDIDIDESYMYVRAALISKEDYQDVTKSLVSFGDEYLDALANKTTKPLTLATDRFKEDITYDFNEDIYYTGQFQELLVDKDSISINIEDDTQELTIDARYVIKDDMHSLVDAPELYEEEYTWKVHLVFNDDQEKWLIHSLMYTDIWTEDSALEVLAGSNILYGPGEEVVQTAQTNSLEEEMKEFMIDYTIASVDAINGRYFGHVSNYITEEGPRRKEAEEYIDYLDSKDIYEEWIDTELESVEEVDEHSWKVTVVETFEIIKPDSSNENSYRTEVIVKMIDDAYYVDELLQTNIIE